MVRHRSGSRRAGVLASVFLALASAACSSLDESRRPITPQGRAIASLFDVTMAASAIVFLLVVGALIYVLGRFRASAPGEPSTTEGNRKLEIAWTASALALIGVLSALALRTLVTVEARSLGPVLTVDAIGHQWWWEFRYPELGVVTANELYLPTGRPVELRIGSIDVIHSFWVPRLGWKRDAVPGKTNLIRVEVDAPGDFGGACAEFCGAQHAWMRVRLVALDGDRFDLWAAGQASAGAAPADDRSRRGFQLFLSNTCVSCHTIRGTAANATVGPDLTHIGGRSTLGAGVIAGSADNLRRWVADPHQVKPGVLMPSFPNLRPDELDDLVVYLRGLK